MGESSVGRQAARSAKLMLIGGTLAGAVLSLILVMAAITPTQTAHGQVFPTNTPAPTPNRPDAPAERYALRLWTEDALIEALTNAINALRPGDEAANRAVALLQRELEQRYPGSPDDAASRDALLSAARHAPPGSVDMRGWARSFAQDALNTARPVFDATAQINVDGWDLLLTAANLDGRGAMDALVRVYAENASDVVFDGYYVASLQADGSFRLLDGDIPAAPFDGDSITVEHYGDLTGDGIDDIVVGIDEGAPNHRLMVLGVRGGEVINLAAPGQTMRYAEIISRVPLTLAVRRLDSALWGCYSDQFVTWTYTRNAFSVSAIIDFTHQDSLGCRLHALDSVYDESPDTAFAQIASVLPTWAFGTNDDVPGSRAQLVEAMLTALNGDPNEAGRLARNISTSDPYLARQRAQFLRMMERGDSALAICEALAQLESIHGGDAPTFERPGVGICDPAEALFRALTDDPLLRANPIRTQLEARGLTVIEERTVREVGRLDRTLVGIDFGGEIQWIAFAPLPASPDTYTAERADAPDNFPLPDEPVPPAPAVPVSVYTLLLDGDGALTPAVLRQALTQLENGRVTTPEARFVRAWINDLLNQRAAAQAEYYAVWSSYPTTVWGQMAAAHLEQR